MKKIVILLCLCMLMSLFSCAPNRSSSPPETTSGQVITTTGVQTSEKTKTLSFKENAEPNSLTEEEKQNIREWYFYFYGLTEDNTLFNSFWSLVKHYGNYKGYVVLYDYPLGPFYSDSVDEMIAGYRFRNPSRFVIRLFKDGEFIELNDENVENGLIDNETLAKIWECHNSAQRIGFRVFDIESPENAAPGTLSDELMETFFDVFEEWAEEGDRNVEEVVNIMHYGNYNGASVFYRPDAAEDDYKVIIYKDGCFKFIYDLRDCMLFMSDEDTEKVQAYHESVSK